MTTTSEMARRSYYDILGVQKGASAEEIKSAYRRLAREFHPDQSDNVADEDRFKAVAEAYQVLGDPAARKRYDTFGWLPQGAVYEASKPRQVATMRAYRPGVSDYVEAVREAVSERLRRRRGEDLKVETTLDFIDALRGTARVFELPRRSRTGRIDARRLEFNIPAGVQDGQRLRWRGEGGPGVGGAASGDLTVHVHVRPHDHFRRHGDDVLLEVWLPLSRVLAGGALTLPGLHGDVEVELAAGAADGHRWRVEGEGVRAAGRPPGAMVYELRWAIPAKIDAEQAALLERFEASLEPAQLPELARWRAWRETGT